MTDLGKHLGRRTLLRSGALGAGALTVTGASGAAAASLVRHRLELPSGVQSGDVTTGSAVLWARSSGRGRLVAEVVSGRRRRRVRGPWADADSDYTAKIALDGL